MRDYKLTLIAVTILSSTAGCGNAFDKSSEKRDDQQPEAFSTEDDSSRSEDDF